MGSRITTENNPWIRMDSCALDYTHSQMISLQPCNVHIEAWCSYWPHRDPGAGPQKWAVSRVNVCIHIRVYAPVCILALPHAFACFLRVHLQTVPCVNRYVCICICIWTYISAFDPPFPSILSSASFLCVCTWAEAPNDGKRRKWVKSILFKSTK